MPDPDIKEPRRRCGCGDGLATLQTGRWISLAGEFIFLQKCQACHDDEVARQVAIGGTEPIIMYRWDDGSDRWVMV